MLLGIQKSTFQIQSLAHINKCLIIQAINYCKLQPNFLNYVVIKSILTCLMRMALFEIIAIHRY